MEVEMKKVISILFCFILLLGITGCGNEIVHLEDNQDNVQDDNNKSEEMSENNNQENNAQSEEMIESNKKALVSIIGDYITDVATNVNEGTYRSLFDPNNVYYVRVSNKESDSCASLDEKGVDPFGEWGEAYVVVQYDSSNYLFNYYFTFYDEAGYSMPITNLSQISSSSISKSSQINKTNITKQTVLSGTPIVIDKTNDCKVS